MRVDISSRSIHCVALDTATASCRSFRMRSANYVEHYIDDHADVQIEIRWRLVLERYQRRPTCIEFTDVYHLQPQTRHWNIHQHHIAFYFICLFIYYYCFIRLEDRLQPNIGFTLRRVLEVFTSSAITPPKVNWFGWSTLSLTTLSGLALADFGRDLRSSDIWRARRNLILVR